MDGRSTYDSRERGSADACKARTEGSEARDLRRFLSALGPGLITGASDDDHSGIGTYSQAGAQLGFGVGWTMLLSYPLMAAIQEISARVGRITGHGIAGNVCRNFGPVCIWSLVLSLFAANTINIAADLGAMGDALRLIIGGPAIACVVLFGATSVLAQIFFNYDRYVFVLKWLIVSLFAYVVALAVIKVSFEYALTGAITSAPEAQRRVPYDGRGNLRHDNIALSFHGSRRRKLKSSGLIPRRGRSTRAPPGRTKNIAGSASAR